MITTEIKKRFYRQYSTYIRIAKVLLALFLFSIGGFIYLVYRIDSLEMFHWVDAVGLDSCVNYLRTKVGSKDLCDWVKFSLPDGLWLISYMFIIDCIWNGCRSNSFYVFVFGLPFFAILSEIFQYYSLLPGVFDVIDLACYILAITLYFIIKIS